ncbi:MAG: hypothetical protein JOS17DRAFT_749606 [Linnemannia elongata]|nr:MAG: hypothetical protein JOS17DRAFT_749606 [Linnemannia elongata]
MLLRTEMEASMDLFLSAMQQDSTQSLVLVRLSVSLYFSLSLLLSLSPSLSLPFSLSSLFSLSLLFLALEKDKGKGEKI